MKIERILENIENKLFEVDALFPETLGSGTDEKFAELCSEFTANLIRVRINLQGIQKTIKKNKKK